MIPLELNTVRDIQPQQPYEIGMVGFGIMGRRFLMNIPSTTVATAIYRF